MTVRRRARRRLDALAGHRATAERTDVRRHGSTVERPHLRRHGDPMVGIARAVSRMLDGLGWESSAGADRAVLRARGGAVVAAALGALVAPLPMAVVVAVAGWHLPRLLTARQQQRAERELVDETMLATELCAIAVHSGRTVPQAIDAIRPFVDGRLGDALDRVVRAHRAGVLLDDLLGETADELGAVVVPLTTILRAAHTDGDPIEPALTRLSDRLRDERRRLVETDVRRLSLRLLLPLVCCSLPGFVLIAVVPLVVGSLGHLGR